jgi:branched-chain amino acid aminotransferase
VAVWKWGKYLGAEAMARGIKVSVASFRRPDVASTLPWAKLSGNYLNSIMARREATLAGCDEAILLDQQGFVAEGSGENVFVVENGALLTPPPGAILLGITRDSIIALAREAGIAVREQAITRNQIYDADEVFFTGTAAEVTPVTTIDGRAIGRGEPGPITTKLATTFERAIRGGLPAWERWLTYV